MYANYLARNASFTFTSESMNDKRKQMMEEVLSGRLLNDEFQPHISTTIFNTVSNNNVLINTEINTNIDGVFLYQSASIHQGDRQFPIERRNSQCTAIATFSIVALPPIIDNNISTFFMDNFIIQGDEYYVDCKVTKKVTFSHLCVDDLLTSFYAFGLLTKMSVIDLPFGQGTFFKNDLTALLLNAVNNCIELSEKLNNCGFLFIGHSKTVSFKISKNKPKSFFLFNSHNVDGNNCTTIKKNGAARLFRCYTPLALVNLLTIDHPRDNQLWQIVCINVI